MPKSFYCISAMIELPEGSAGAKSEVIAKAQPAIAAFRAALDKQGVALSVTDKITSPKGPRAVKPVADAGGAED